MPTTRKRILFLCTANSCRSQMAEGLLRHMAGDRFQAVSAGSRPAGFVHPIARETLIQLGVPPEDLERLESKHWEAFLSKPTDACITVCDNASADCPVWPGQGLRVHWGLPDPVFFEGTDEERAAFAVEIGKRLLRKIKRMASLDWDQLPSDRLLIQLQKLAEL